MPFQVTYSVRACLLGLAIMAAAPSPGSAEALLLIEANSGKVLKAENATVPWYPASTSKLLTTYVTLKAIKEGRLTFDTLLTVSPNATAQEPSKMGFRVGTQLTVDNALKMMLVHSANDMAVVLAEGVDGSIEKFADEMNAVSQQLGMTQSHWVNPNGLPDDRQITSARDMAILARALIRDFPEDDFYWHIPAIRLGRKVMRNYNTLIGRYPGTDGMKTGFICASGYNLVASATRDDRRLIAVVYGAPSSAVRAAQAAALLERGFNAGALSWLAPSLGTVENLKPVNVDPPNLHDQVCGKHRRRPAAEESDTDEQGAQVNGDATPQAFLPATLQGGSPTPSLIGPYVETEQPIRVFVGPPRPPKATAVAAAPARPSVAHTVRAARAAKKPIAASLAIRASVKRTAIAGKPRTAKPSTSRVRPAATTSTAARTAADARRPAAKLKPKPKTATAKPAAQTAQ